jgi:DNA-binding helix-hairpin-helix protein with protein kinase domain
MKRLICSKTGRTVHLVNRISVSGEGEVWETDDPAQVAKIYAAPGVGVGGDRIRKLETMVAFPPDDPNRGIDHISFAWPLSILRESYGMSVGFLMPNITGSLELINVYNPKRRRHVLPGFNWLYLHTTALNVASLLWRLHATGFVVGDIKPQNILVNSQALPSIIDTDSFQVCHPHTGEVFPCPVGSEGFTPRELLGQDLATVHQSEVHDRFRLGVIIYLLLFGEHPFKGQWVGAGDAPEPNELVEKGFWPFAERSLIHPGPSTISLDVVHPLIRENFMRCFNEGHDDPARRPSAQEWVRVLDTAIAQLKGCWSDRRHYYSATYGRCIWCERRRVLGVDIFNPKEVVTSPPQPSLSPELFREKTRITVTQGQATRRQSTQPPTPLSYSPRPHASSKGTVSPSSANGVGSVSEMVNAVVQWGRSPDLKTLPASVKMLGGMGGLLMIFLLLIRLSSVEMTADEVGLSVVGAIACLALVLVGFFWIKLLGQSNQQ